MKNNFETHYFHTLKKVRGFEKSTEFFKKVRTFQYHRNNKKGWSRPLTLIMELIINKVRSITLPPRISFEIDRTKPFKSQKKHMFFWLNKILYWLKMASQTVQDIRNGWAPEIKRLNDNLEKLEASLTGTDECVLDIYSLEETLQDKINILDAELTTVKADVAELKDHLTSVIKELDVVTNGGIEEELFGVKAENIEMRNHFNSMIKQLNKITAFVNQKHGYRIIEETYGFDEIDRGTTPPNSPRDDKYNLRSHVIDME